MKTCKVGNKDAGDKSFIIKRKLLETSLAQSN